MSPQHWSQVADDNTPEHYGTWCATYADSIVLEWDQRRYRRNIPLSSRTNVGMLRTAPGTKAFTALSSTFELLEPPPFATPTYIPAYEYDGIDPTELPTAAPPIVPTVTPPVLLIVVPHIRPPVMRLRGNLPWTLPLHLPLLPLRQLY